MLYNEYHRIYQAGVDDGRLTVFMMRDYDLGFPEDGLYATAEMAARYPEECLALRRATLKGWEYAREHPEEAIDAVLRESRESRVPVNRPHVKWMLDHILLSVFPADDAGVTGCLDLEVYRKVAEMLKAADLIDEAPEFESFALFDTEMP